MGPATGLAERTRVDEAADEAWLTRLDFDQAFGTAINRFCCQAVIGHPLTLFGQGHQKRGFLPLRDSMQCLTLALEHPPHAGEYRVLNQFEEVYDLTELAEKVRRVGATLGLDVARAHVTSLRALLDPYVVALDEDGERALLRLCPSVDAPSLAALPRGAGWCVEPHAEEQRGWSAAADQRREDQAS